MDRRGFFQKAMIAASVLAIDPEKLLWVPGKKRIFIPSVDSEWQWQIGHLFCSRKETADYVIATVSNNRGIKSEIIGILRNSGIYEFNAPITVTDADTVDFTYHALL